MNLKHALRVSHDSRVALVGAGGKTTTLFALARALEGSVILTNSAHLGRQQALLADRHFVIRTESEVDKIFNDLGGGVILITGAEYESGRLISPGDEALRRIYEYADRLHLPVLVEADGSRMRPLKAPASHEPPIPEWINLVVVVCGLSGLGQPLNEATVFRSDLFAKLTGLEPGSPVTPSALITYLLHPQGGLKDIPSGARRAVLLNQWDECVPEYQAEILQHLKRLYSGYDAVLLGNVIRGGEQAVVAVHQPVAGIVLAAGESRRFGQPKQLLEWNGRPLIRVVVERALQADLSPVIVVVGATVEPIQAALADMPVEIIVNPKWQEGVATSVVCGIKALPEQVGAALFLLSDQPFVSVDLIRALVEKHARTLAPIVAPFVGERRANPVLFDRITFPALRQIRGDVGGRAVFDQYSVLALPWSDERILLDIDQPADWEQARKMKRRACRGE